LSATHPDPPVDAILLAAGRSARMGEPKPLLELDGESFIERGIRALRDGGCRIVVAVVDEQADWAVRLADATGALVELSDDPGAEPIDSVRRALAHIPGDAAAVLLLPVDHPAVKPATVAAVIESFRRDPAPVVRPAHRGRPGHPTLFARSLFDELRGGELPLGARSVIDAHAGEVRDLEVDDPGVVTDVNTPDDYRRLTRP
jgi:molybdenum cofactor cytidylyltransferase